MPYLLALGSAVLYGAADFLGGLASRRASTLAVVLVSQCAGLLLLVVLLPFLPGQAPSQDDLVWGGLAGLAGGAGVGLLYRALAIGTMGLVAPTTAVFAVAIPVVVAVALGERPTPPTLAGIALAVLAIVLVSRQSGPDVPTTSTRPPRSGVPAGLGLAVTSGVAIGLFYLALARTDAAAGMWPLVAARAASVSLFGLAVRLRGAPMRMTAPVATIVVGGGALDMFANALYLIASRSGPLSVVVTLASLYPASTVLLARVVVGERLNAWQTAGVACALGAVVLIVWSAA